MHARILVAVLVLGGLGGGLAWGDEPKSPRPVVTWAEGPLDVRVAFDAAVDPALTKALTGQTISFVETVGPEQKGQEAPRGSIRIAAARLIDDGRTLVLATDPHPRAGTYTLTLPEVRAPGQPGPGQTFEPHYDLHGVSATWEEGDAGADEPAWSGWWPHLDPDITRARTAGSVEHDRALALLTQPGRLALRGLVEVAEGEANLEIEASEPFQATLGFGEEIASESPSPGVHRAALEGEAYGTAIELNVSVQTGAGGKPLSLKVNSAGGNPLSAEKLLIPWAPEPPPASVTPDQAPPDLTGGDPRRGETLFFSDEAKCSQCHRFRGRGGEIGPDLSNLFQTSDTATVYRDINLPSARIDPSYVPYTIAETNGQVFAGLVRAEGADSIRVINSDAQATILPKSEIEELRPSSTSIMPVGLAGALGEDQLRDLISFLLSPPPASPSEP